MLIHTLKQIRKSLHQSASYDSLNTVYIYAQAIINNFYALQELQPNHTIIPVVKSNAYGHGLTQIAQIIERIPTEDLPLIAVDSYPEYQIIAKHTTKSILIL